MGISMIPSGSMGRSTQPNGYHFCLGTVQDIGMGYGVHAVIWWEKTGGNCNSPYQNSPALFDPVTGIILDFFRNPIVFVTLLNFHYFPIMGIYDKSL